MIEMILRKVEKLDEQIRALEKENERGSLKIKERS